MGKGKEPWPMEPQMQLKAQKPQVQLKVRRPQLRRSPLKTSSLYILFMWSSTWAYLIFSGQIIEDKSLIGAIQCSAEKVFSDVGLMEIAKWRTHSEEVSRTLGKDH
jgi:hypothetical protein